MIYSSQKRKPEEQTPAENQQYQVTQMPTVSTEEYKPKYNITGYEPPTAEAGQSQFTQYEVDPTKTIEGRMSGLLSQDSDYMKRAEAKGLSVANSRGLMNSSMAAGAAQASAIDAALPIAQGDAGLYADQRLANQKYQHDVDNLNAQLNTSVNLENAGFANQAAQMKADAQNKLAAMEQDNLFTKDRMSFDAQINERAQQIANAHEVRMKEMGLAADVTNTFNEVTGRALQQLTDATSQIYMSDMPSAEKQRALDYLMVNYQSQVDTMAVLAGKEITWDNFEGNMNNQNSGKHTITLETGKEIPIWESKDFDVKTDSPVAYPDKPEDFRPTVARDVRKYNDQLKEFNEQIEEYNEEFGTSYPKAPLVPFASHNPATRELHGDAQ